MATNETTGTPAATGAGNAMTMAQVQALSDHMFEVLYIKDGEAAPRQMNSSDPRRCYYSKAQIDALFAANPECDGLFIYFGVNNLRLHPLPSRPSTYENKLTAMLVPTKSSSPVPLAARAMPVAGTAGHLMAAGDPKLCPPDICT
ncbi:MAG TPA: hypothetical protein VG367_16570 [Mucilaginibacter sp.]|jgi:hypothetical protein|nr:hypothetical protein [Mucilaginibacter sp.]